jgi:3-hydroxyacyl-CoA dehydrogenase/enoyl-CoA hydratase/3-hydroxybutyryl-CoA epimerase
MGAKNFLALCQKLEAKHGERFAAPKIVRDMAASGGTFYGRAEERKAA